MYAVFFAMIPTIFPTFYMSMFINVTFFLGSRLCYFFMFRAFLIKQNSFFSNKFFVRLHISPRNFWHLCFNCYGIYLMFSRLCSLPYVLSYSYSQITVSTHKYLLSESNRRQLKYFSLSQYDFT